MAEKRHDPDGISRREFGVRIGTAAGLAAGGGLLSGRLEAAPYVGGRVLGANDRARLGTAAAILRKSTSSRVADRAAIENALVKAGVAIPVEDGHA